jgi:RNA polymerase sigma factor (sigma-70 family)
VALHYRKHKRDRQVSEAQHWWKGLDGEKLDWIEGKAEPPFEVLQSRELATLVRSALSKLSPEYQAVLLAKYVDNEGVDGIAKRMNCSPVAIRSKLARARRSFQKAFRKITC